METRKSTFLLSTVMLNLPMRCQRIERVVRGADDFDVHFAEQVTGVGEVVGTDMAGE